MWGLVLALAVVGGLVGAAATRPGRRAVLDESRLRGLRALLRRGRLSLDQAEDGAVLARRAGRTDLEQQFALSAASIKKRQRAGRK
jgi:hypothetical protein